MAPRFPPLAAIKKNLIYTRGPLMEASLAGSLSAMYEIACDEFEKLRELAQAALDGDIDDRERLAKYLLEVECTADLYAAANDEIAMPG